MKKYLFKECFFRYGFLKFFSKNQSSLNDWALMDS